MRDLPVWTGEMAVEAWAELDDDERGELVDARLEEEEMQLWTQLQRKAAGRMLCNRRVRTRLRGGDNLSHLQDLEE